MLMYTRIDDKSPYSGHSYIEPDRLFAHIQQEARPRECISDIHDWMEIAAECTRHNPPRVVYFEQDEHQDWQSFLSQYYVTSRKNFDGIKTKLMDAVWRNYGVGEELVDPGDGSPPRVELVAHPGEVWLRYTHDDTEPWTKVDLRRNAKKKDQGQYSRTGDKMYSSIRTKVSNLCHAMCDCVSNSGCVIQDLPPVEDFPPYTKPVPLSNATGDSNFPLYTGPRPISAEKKADLVALCEHLPAEKHAFYKGLHVDGDVGDSGDELALDGPVMDALAAIEVEATD